MPIDPKKLAAILQQAKATATKEVEDPSVMKSTATGPALEKDPLESVEASLGITEKDATPATPPVSVLTLVSPPAQSEIDFSYPGLYELSERIIRLDRAIQSNHPEFDSLLQTIHRNLDKDEQLLHLLKPDQISTIFKGLKKKTQTVIVEDTVKSSSAGRGPRGLKNIALEDL